MLPRSGGAFRMCGCGISCGLRAGEDEVSVCVISCLVGVTQGCLPRFGSVFVGGVSVDYGQCWIGVTLHELLCWYSFNLNGILGTHLASDRIARAILRAGSRWLSKLVLCQSSRYDIPLSSWAKHPAEQSSDLSKSKELIRTVSR